MIYLDLPTINGSGTIEQQLSEIRSYIYRSNEQLNASLSNLTVDKVWEQTASALSASNGENEEKADVLTKYQKLRDLVIKTADVIVQSDEQWKMAMNGNYLAKSQFGEYLLNTSVEIDGNSTGISQLYTYSSELRTDYDNYKIYQQNFIKQGLLDDSKGEAIYGIDIGLLNKTIDFIKKDGTTQTVKEIPNNKIRITPSKLSFFDGTTETAYIEEGAIHFPKANITGGSININDKFTVDSEGNLTAESGTFNGNLTTKALTTSWNEWSNDGIKLECSQEGSQKVSQINTYYGREKIFSISPNKLAFYKLYTDDSSHEMANIQRLSYGNHSGLGIKLEFPYGSFFTIAKDSDYSPGYAPLITYSRGQSNQYFSGEDNIYNASGLHIETPCYFHNQTICNATLENVNLNNITSSGCATQSGTTEILVRNPSGSEFWTTLTIKNGLIVGIHEGAFA